jgi:3-deoxy-7-phosphoheptulonate synthase
MAPEARSSPILAEAEQIVERLLPLEEELHRMTIEIEDGLISGLHNEMGYDYFRAADISGLVDTRLEEMIPVITPKFLESILPVSLQSREIVQDSRLACQQILFGKDGRLIVIVGPCSVHDPEATVEYAAQVRQWREKYGESLEILMRYYIEKPRTELGWKGFIYDPWLDDSYDINLGVTAARLLATHITRLGVPLAVERLNARTPQYLNGLVTYDAIGARNTTDQKAREYASGTSSVVGFKNTPEGSIEAAVQAVKAANAPHIFLGQNTSGFSTKVPTKGNPTAHIILRGGKDGPNYSHIHIEEAKSLLNKSNLLEAIIVDASHGNSVINVETGEKDPYKQKEVILDVGQQIAIGEMAIKGVAIESNIKGGKQNLVALGPENLEYGLSITDACIPIDETQDLLGILSVAAKRRRLHAK